MASEIRKQARALIKAKLAYWNQLRDFEALLGDGVDTDEIPEIVEDISTAINYPSDINKRIIDAFLKEVGVNDKGESTSAASPGSTTHSVVEPECNTHER